MSEINELIEKLQLLLISIPSYIVILKMSDMNELDYQKSLRFNFKHYLVNKSVNFRIRKINQRMDLYVSLCKNNKKNLPVLSWSTFISIFYFSFDF